MACLLDGAAQTASVTGVWQLMNMYTLPAQQLATANQDYLTTLCNYRVKGSVLPA